MYSRELESIAQRHSSGCSFNHNDHRSRQSHLFSSVGENIFYGRSKLFLSYLFNDVSSEWKKRFYTSGFIFWNLFFNNGMLFIFRTEGDNITDAIEYWREQGDYYNIRTNECQLFKFCEYYTQVLVGYQNQLN